MPEVRLNASDAAELAELLQFLSGWLARDPGRLGASLADYAANPAYDTPQLRPDLDRFIFLLAGDYWDANSTHHTPPGSASPRALRPAVPAWSCRSRPRP
jgi:hypothetical protein